MRSRFFGSDAHACVGDGDDGFAVRSGDGHGDASACSGVFESIGEQVVQYLFQLSAVELRFERCFGSREKELDAALHGVVVEQDPDALRDGRQILAGDMQPQARLVEPSDVDDLVDHVLQTLCVAVDAEYAVVDRRSDVLPHEQYLDLSHDERQRRAEFVGHVGEEAEFLCVGLFDVFFFQLLDAQNLL